MTRILMILFLMISVLIAQIHSLDAIQGNVIAQFDQIKDYRVNIKISVKMTGFRMPRKKIQMYYKKPNKIKIEADGFAILPKTGVGGNPNEYFDMLKEIIEITAFQLDGKPFYKITGHVNQDSLEIPISIHEQDSLDIKMNVFIDAVAWTINKVVVALNSEYVFTFETTYTEVDGISVPEKSEFKLGIQGMSRWTTRNPFGGPSEDRKDFEAIAKGVGFDPEKDEFAGTVVMEFSKYKVNQGLDDSIFE